MLMIGKQLTAEQRLDKAVIDIMGNPRYIALAGVIMIGTRRIDDNIPTAGTNGRDEMYGRKFIESLTDAELRFLVLHEVYHKLYRHLTTWKHLHDENHMLANVSCDHVINLKIIAENADGFAKMPSRDGKPIGVADPQFKDMDSAQVFNILKRKQQETHNANSQACQANPESSDGQGQGKPQPGQPQSGQPQSGQGEGGGLDDHDWEGAQEMSDEEKKSLEREIDEAVRQGVLAAGKLGTGGTRDLEQMLQPKVDWREVLREFVKTTCTGNDFSTWRRPNRRFVSSGIYMPSGVSEQIGELVIAVDTSGSIHGTILAQFLGEISAIAETVKPSAVRLLYWDTSVCRDERYEGEQVRNIVQSTKPAGGGGTLVSCVNKYMTEHNINPQAVVVLTDGYLGSDWGSWTVPVLWCIVGSTKVAPVGVTVHVKD